MRAGSRHVILRRALSRSKGLPKDEGEAMPAINSPHSATTAHHPQRPAQESAAMPPARRILVIGIAGAGKSVLAAKLGAALRLPVIHLDSHFWKPGWQSVPRDEFRTLVAELVKPEEWVMDGHYRSTLDIRLPAADTVVLLDLPRTLCIWRVIVRWITHIGRTRPDMGPGCPEKVDWVFIMWIWNFPRTHLSETLQRLDELPESTSVHHLRSRREIDRFLTSIRSPSFSPPGRRSG